ncbi:MAG TPA: molecular chaperone HtpG [Anaerolineales bacterium]|nr:molecular chaperone HtpG [Anaerolineales bacterium]
MTSAPAPEAVQFRAEIRQLLHILVHSLYTDREIFLRELISNASDALNRLQFELLTNRDVLDPEAELAIRLSGDPKERTLTIRDTGMGMTREELVENLGTIAHSGAVAFLESLEEGQKVADLIGQFGVGFYSVFMVAEEVRVTSRSYRPEAAAWTWVSSGGETYTLEPAEKTDRGTTIQVKLKEDAQEFAEIYRLQEVVHKHSDFVSFPIYVGDNAQAVNRQTALWREAAAKIADEAADDFYKQLTLDFEKPLARIHLNTDAPTQIYALLFIPAKADRGIFSLRKDHGLKLYSRKILIQDYCKDLLPHYGRFVQGVVESEDLPLNVSRETVQASRVMERIKTALTHKVIDTLKDLAAKEADQYRAFWQEYSSFIKEGLATDFSAREKLTPLLRFYSSRDAGSELTSLAEYAGRMKPEQRAIYYILGGDVKSAARSPHLDYFRQAGLEVLYLVDPLDSFMLAGLQPYEGFPLKNVDDPTLDLPAEKAKEGEEEGVPPAEFEALVARFKAQLGERIADVRASDRLVDNPLRLVSPDDAKGREMDRIRRLLEKDFTIPQKVVEINRRHPIIKNLAGLVTAGGSDSLVNDCIEQLYENGLLLEGLHPNPAEMVGRIQALIEAATK